MPRHLKQQVMTTTKQPILFASIHHNRLKVLVISTLMSSCKFLNDFNQITKKPVLTHYMLGNITLMSFSGNLVIPALHGIDWFSPLHWQL